MSNIAHFSTCTAWYILWWQVKTFFNDKPGTRINNNYKKNELLMNVNEINLILPNIQGKNTFDIIAPRYTGQ